MEFEFFDDPRIGKSHLADHNVSIDEVKEFFSEIDYFERERSDGSFVAYGKISSGRYLEFVYRKKSRNKLYYIITGYDIEDISKIIEIEENL